MPTLHAPTPATFAVPRYAPPRATAFTAPTAAPPDDAGAASQRSLAAAATARLGPVCASWPPEQFAELIADVVRFHQRWASWDAAP